MPEVGMHEPTVVRVEFHDHGAKTRMTLTDGPFPPEGHGHAEAGYDAALDKLAMLVAGQRPLQRRRTADEAELERGSRAAIPAPRRGGVAPLRLQPLSA
jgi:hypothetical protein